jgi:hypothetical protein
MFRLKICLDKGILAVAEGFLTADPFDFRRVGPVID